MEEPIDPTERRIRVSLTRDIKQVLKECKKKKDNIGMTRVKLI